MDNPGKPPLILRILHGIEDVLIVCMLTAMILIAFMQIILRNFAGAGFVWGDALLRVMVLWVGLLGAMIATREDNQITVDVLSPLLSPRAKTAVRVATDAFASIVCALLAYGSVQFLKDEYAGGVIAFGKTPAWAAESILPVAFATMSLRYFVYFLRHAYRSIKYVPDTDAGGSRP
jgi:TRAP-type C4-dicarboxylate transport system permease small subunit